MSDVRGFTLIELLVVIAIIGILAAAAVPQVMDAICDARVSGAQGDMATIQTAATQCQMDNDCDFESSNGDWAAGWDAYLPSRITDDTEGAAWDITITDGQVEVIHVDDVGCTWEDEEGETSEEMYFDPDTGNFYATDPAV